MTFSFFWVSLYDSPDGVLSQPLFLVTFAQVLCLVRLLGDLLADMGAMLTKFCVPRKVQP